MRILAAVYNPIAYDGRVQRECEALSEIADVELVCPDGPHVPKGLSFNVRTIQLAWGKDARLSRHLRFAWAVVSLACDMRPDVVHAHDFFMAVPGLLAARLTGAKLIYDAHELIVPEPGLVMSGRRRFWYRSERCAVARANLVIAANSDRSRLMQEHYRLKKRPLVIRNIPPTPLECEQVEMKDVRRSDSEYLCVYQGDVSLRRGLGRFLEAVPLMPRNIRILIVGGGPDEPAVRQVVERLGITERVSMLGRVPREQLHGILRACDVGLLMYPFLGLNNIYCAPNKVFEYAQAGLPIVATNQSPLEQILASYRIGASFGQFDAPSTVAARVVSVIENRKGYREGLSRFLSENTWTDEAQRLRNAVLAMVGGAESVGASGKQD